MKKSFVIFSFLWFSVMNLFSQTVTLPADTQVLTLGAVVIKGKPVPYKASTGPSLKIPRSVGETRTTPFKYIHWLFCNSSAKPETLVVP